MALPFQVYLAGTTTTAEGAIAFETVAGTESGYLPLDVWCNYGVSGGSEAGARLQMQVWDADSSSWLASGHPALDGHHFSAAVVGLINSSGSPMIAQTTNWIRLGTDSELELSPMPGNSARTIYLRYRPPLEAGAASSQITCRLVVVAAVPARGAAPGLGRLGDGILRMVRCRTMRAWVDFPTVTATGTPDDYVHVSRRYWLGRGKPFRKLAEDVQLTQTASDGALGSGQRYYAVISQAVDGGAVTSTKGVKGTAPAVPTLPSGHLYIATVTVLYQAGGTSVIQESHISALGYGGEFKPADGGGLTVTVDPGEAIAGGQWVTLAGRSTVVISASTTNRVWLTPAGTLDVNAADTPPSDGSLWICTATTDTDSVTALVDKREAYYHPAGVATLTLAKTGTEATGTNVASTQVPAHCYVVGVILSVRTPSVGATGATKVDINRSTAGGAYTTIFTNQGGAVESLPQVAAQGYRDTTGYPEVLELLPGDWLSLDIDAITSGGTQAVDVAASLLVSMA